MSEKTEAIACERCRKLDLPIEKLTFKITAKHKSLECGRLTWPHEKWLCDWCLKIFIDEAADFSEKVAENGQKTG